jgi:hypothetical protein
LSVLLNTESTASKSGGFYPLGSKGIKCGRCADRLSTICPIETLETTTILGTSVSKQISTRRKQEEIK